MTFALAIDTPRGHDDLDGVAPPPATLRLVGHAASWSAFTRAADGDRLHHAWLLHGPEGIGKATAAYAFARHLLAPTAEHRGQEPTTVSFSGENATVRQIALDTHPGLTHVTRPPVERGTGFRAQITVDEIRRLTRFFQATASGQSWRIAIVDPVDDMNRNAANALLKLLEEPPRRAIFFLVSHAPGRLLPTIRSRCRAARFAPLSTTEVGAVLADAMPSASTDDRAFATELSGGSVRRAVAMLAGGGTEIGQSLDELLKADRANWNALQALADTVTAKGRESAYDLLMDRFFEAIAQESERALEDGDAATAADLARLWQEQSDRVREATAYNLDRKQVFLTLCDAFFRARGNASRTEPAAPAS